LVALLPYARHSGLDALCVGADWRNLFWRDLDDTLYQGLMVGTIRPARAFLHFPEQGQGSGRNAVATVNKQAAKAESGNPATGEPEEWTFFSARYGRKEWAQVFEVYASADGEGSPPFRTLIWQAELPATTNMSKLAEECFRLAYGDESFELALDNPSAIVFTRIRRESENPERVLVVKDRFDAAVTAETVDYLRIDSRNTTGMISFSCRSLGTDGFELTVLMEAEHRFLIGLVEWALSRHVLPLLREPGTVHVQEVLEFVNSDWRGLRSRDD
jgi:hypothetical protein